MLRTLGCIGSLELEHLFEPHRLGSFVEVREMGRTRYVSWIKTEGVPLLREVLQRVEACPDLTAADRAKFQSRLHSTFLEHAQKHLATSREHIGLLTELGRKYGICVDDTQPSKQQSPLTASSVSSSTPRGDT